MSQGLAEVCLEILFAFFACLSLVCLFITDSFFRLPQADASHSRRTSLNALPADLINAPRALPPTEPEHHQHGPHLPVCVFVCVVAEGEVVSKPAKLAPSRDRWKPERLR